MRVRKFISDWMMKSGLVGMTLGIGASLMGSQSAIYGVGFGLLFILLSIQVDPEND